LFTLHNSADNQLNDDATKQSFFMIRIRLTYKYDIPVTGITLNYVLLLTDAGGDPGGAR
jgi:hypothetical protein